MTASDWVAVIVTPLYVGGVAWAVSLFRPRRRRRPRPPSPYPRRLLVIPGPSIGPDDWDGPNLKPGVIERFDAELMALIDRLKSL